MKTLLTTVIFLLSIIISYGQINPSQQPIDYSPTLSNEIYTMELGIVKRFLFSSLDSLFSSGSFSEITNISDTSGISSAQLGDIAINSGNDTLLFRSTYGWLVFVGGSGGGGGSMDDWTLQADSGSAATISDAENVTIAGGGIASTAISGNTVTVTATEVDGSTTNEIQTVDTLSYSSGTITLALESDDEAPYTVDISAVNTDAQTLSISGDDLSISGGNSQDVSGAGTYALTEITADGTDTIDFNTQVGGYWRLKMNGISTHDSLVFTNPRTATVPTYSIHIDSVDTDTIVFPSNLVDANREALGSRRFIRGTQLTFFYDPIDDLYVSANEVGVSVTVPTADTPADTLPTDFSGMQLWLKSDTLLSTSGSSVTAWTDVIAGTYVFEVPIGDDWPTVATNELNGYSAVYFDGVDDALLEEAFISSNTGTVIVVGKLPASESRGYPICFVDQSSETDWFMPVDFSNDIDSTARYVFKDSPNDIVDGSTKTYNQYISAASTSDGSTISLFVNGSGETENVSSGTNSGKWTNDVTGGDAMSLGSNYKLTALYSEVYIVEVMVWNVELSANDIQAIYDGYITPRYGL